MIESANEYFEIDPDNNDLLIYKTDFEYISYENEEVNNKCFYLDDEDIVYIRFIYEPDYRLRFRDSKLQNSLLNKFFFLPTHKTKEFKETINEQVENRVFSSELKEYYTKEMIDDLQPEGYYLLPSYFNKVKPKERQNHSTSLFILFDKKRYEEVGDISYEGILKLRDIKEMSEEEKKEYLLNSGLDICSQLPLYKYLISFGIIKSTQGLLEWEQTFRTSNPEPGSSHVHFFKIDKNINDVSYQEVANQFNLVDLKTTLKKPKRQNSKRRGGLINEASK